MALKDYELVETRLARFWDENPNGRVHTEIVDGTHGGESVIVVASVYKDKADLYPDATGHAQETPGSSNVNKTSWVENCETSAIGRALANMGYAPKGARPSREEMAKVAAPRPDPPSAGRRSSTKPKGTAWADKTQAQRDLLDTAKELKINADLRHRLIRRITEGATQSTDDLSDDACRKTQAQLKVFAAYREAGMKNLEEWEAQQ